MSERTHTLRIPGGVPGILLRLVVVALVTVGVVILNPFPLWQGVAIIASLVAVVVPRLLAAWIAAACLPFGVLLSEPSIAHTALAALIVHAIHLFASYALVVPVRSRLAVRTMVPGLWRFLIAQLIAQPLLLGVQLLVPGRAVDGISWLAPVAAAALVAGLAVTLRALKQADAQAGKPRRVGATITAKTASKD